MRSANATFGRLAHVLDDLVDPAVGVIRWVREMPREPGGPDFFHFGAIACETQAFTRHTNFKANGGAAADRNVALAKAIGESVERYCSAIYQLESLPLSCFDRATFACVEPAAFALYTRQQHAAPGWPLRPFERDTPVRWTPARDLATGEEVHVPAAMVYAPYLFYRDSGDTPILQPITTGLAAHLSFAEAAVTALCEVIERDAFTITWQAALPRPRLRLATLSAANRDLVARFERTGASVALFDLTSDAGVPTIASVVRNPHPGASALVFSASTELDPERAVRKSLEELAHTRWYAQGLKSAQPPLPLGGPYEELVVAQEDHIHLYNDPANAHLAEFLTASAETRSFDEIENLDTGVAPDNLRLLGEKIHAVGHRVLLADLTTPDVAPLGFSVVRAVVPGFHPLQMGHRYRALGGSRLWNVPQRLGYAGVHPRTGDNPAPHPFP